MNADSKQPKKRRRSTAKQMDTRPLVTITGVSGFVGSQVCLHFLQHGGFKVRGTVRNKTNYKKIQPLQEAFGDLFDQLELAEADLNDEQSMINACMGSDYIVHTASPYPTTDPEDESELIDPAVNGTLAAMKAASFARAKKIVITSSIIAIGMGHGGRTVFNEQDWSQPDSIETRVAYAKSKLFAEQAAWDYVNDLPDDEKFDIVTICPGLVIGPNLIKKNFSSGDLVAAIMMGILPDIPKISVVDVRNVAEAHLEAVLREEANNQRFIVANEVLTVSDCAKILAAKFPNYPIDTTVKKENGLEFEYENHKSRSVLGINYISAKRSLEDMGDALIAAGYVEDKRQKQQTNKYYY